MKLNQRIFSNRFINIQLSLGHSGESSFISLCVESTETIAIFQHA